MISKDKRTQLLVGVNFRFASRDFFAFFFSSKIFPEIEFSALRTLTLDLGYFRVKMHPRAGGRGGGLARVKSRASKKKKNVNFRWP